MQPETDTLRRAMRIERIERDDGRVLLLYSWQTPTPDVAPGRRRDEPPIAPWSPEAGPADV